MKKIEAVIRPFKLAEVKALCLELTLKAGKVSRARPPLTCNSKTAFGREESIDTRPGSSRSPVSAIIACLAPGTWGDRAPGWRQIHHHGTMVTR